MRGGRPPLMAGCRRSFATTSRAARSVLDPAARARLPSEHRRTFKCELAGSAAPGSSETRNDHGTGTRVANTELKSLEQLTQELYNTPGTKGKRLIRAFESPCSELFFSRNPAVTKGTPLEDRRLRRSRSGCHRRVTRSRRPRSGARSAAGRGSTRAGPGSSDDDEGPAEGLETPRDSVATPGGVG